MHYETVEKMAKETTQTDFFIQNVIGGWTNLVNVVGPIVGSARMIPIIQWKHSILGNKVGGGVGFSKQLSMWM